MNNFSTNKKKSFDSSSTGGAGERAGWRQRPPVEPEAEETGYPPLPEVQQREVISLISKSDPSWLRFDTLPLPERRRHLTLLSVGSACAHSVCKDTTVQVANVFVTWKTALKVMEAKASSFFLLLFEHSLSGSLLLPLRISRLGGSDVSLSKQMLYSERLHSHKQSINCVQHSKSDLICIGNYCIIFLYLFIEFSS